MERIGWTVIERVQPSDQFIGAWIIKRSSQRILDFDGIFDGLGKTIKNPSPEKAYGCKIRNTDISLYFYKKGEQWNKSLHDFIDKMNDLG